MHRRPYGSDTDGAATARNQLPWREMEQELARRLAARRANAGAEREKEEKRRRRSAPSRSELPVDEDRDEEPVPDSGVRSNTRDPLDEPMRPLTYSVYTLSELDEARAPAFRPARQSVPAMSSRWGDVRRSAFAVLRAWWSFVRMPKPRPRMLDVCRAPLVALGTDLRAALGQLPWRRVGGWLAAGVGALALVFFAIVTVAELTDDLRPSRSTAAASKARPNTSPAMRPATSPDMGGEPAVTAAAKIGGTTVAAPAAAAHAAGATAEPVIELEDDPPPPSAKTALSKPRSKATDKADNKDNKKRARITDPFKP